MRKITYNADGNALLVELSDQPFDHAEDAPDGSIVLVEILDARAFVLGAVQGVLKSQDAPAS